MASLTFTKQVPSVKLKKIRRCLNLDKKLGLKINPEAIIFIYWKEEYYFYSTCELEQELVDLLQIIFLRKEYIFPQLIK